MPFSPPFWHFLKVKEGPKCLFRRFSFFFFSCILKMALNNGNDEWRSCLSAGDIRNNSFYDIGRASAHTLDRMVYGPMLTQWFSCFAGPQPGLCIWRFLLFLITGLAALRQQSCRRVSVFSPCWPACRKRAPLRRSFFIFYFFLHIKDSLKMTINGVIDKRLDVRNDSFYVNDIRANASPLPYGL